MTAHPTMHAAPTKKNKTTHRATRGLIVTTDPIILAERFAKLSLFFERVAPLVVPSSILSRSLALLDLLRRSSSELRDSLSDRENDSERERDVGVFDSRFRQGHNSYLLLATRLSFRVKQAVKNVICNMNVPKIARAVAMAKYRNIGKVTIMLHIRATMSVHELNSMEQPTSRNAQHTLSSGKIILDSLGALSTASTIIIISSIPIPKITKIAKKATVVNGISSQPQRPKAKINA
mmetsp:Transcript_13569/g.20246  ORF Transcript_13569/g.20246 Transcript_13569/m.20246 type:complete len:235 (-) Transcript_13569:317-1021(-)